jgi:PAS domain S-box-containing protein
MNNSNSAQMAQSRCSIPLASSWRAARIMATTPDATCRIHPSSEIEARGQPTVVYYFKSPLDEVQRLSFYKQSDRFPLMVLATMAQDDVLAPWHKNAVIRMLFVLVLTSLIAIIGFFLVRQLIRGQRLVSALAAKEADFRLLAEKSSDMVTRIGLDERMQYVSPSSDRIVGWKAEQLTGTPALAGVNTEDLPKVRDVVAALKRGDVTEARLVYRTRHRDAKEVWIESTMQVTRNLDTGKIDGVVAISRDVTQQKNAEAKLAALAILDGLTGLANRRRFDERLQEEWARACREGTSLSLLMVDVDHFKKFNDQYGHQAGDACLQTLAQVLATEARRPADLAVRYGGEEFAMRPASSICMTGSRTSATMDRPPVKIPWWICKWPTARGRGSPRCSSSAGGMSGMKVSSAASALSLSLPGRSTFPRISK